MGWAALIRKVYEVDPLRCPDCGGEMKVINFIDKSQADGVEKIVRHCGQWKGVVSRPLLVANRAADCESSNKYGHC